MRLLPFQLILFKFVTLHFFYGKNVVRFVSKGFRNCTTIAGQSPQSVGLQRSRMIGTLPGPVEGIMPLYPLGTQGHGRHIHGNSQMMARKPDGLHPVSKLFPKSMNFVETNILKGNRIARSTAVKYQVLAATGRLKQLHHLLLLLTSGHAKRNVHFSAIVFTKVQKQGLILVAGRGNLYQGGFNAAISRAELTSQTEV